MMLLLIDFLVSPLQGYVITIHFDRRLAPTAKHVDPLRGLGLNYTQLR